MDWEWEGGNKSPNTSKYDLQWMKFQLSLSVYMYILCYNPIQNF